MTLPTLIPVPTTSADTVVGAFLLAVDTLKDLPTERDVLVSLLTDLGIKGIPSSGTRCVLAEYVRATLDMSDEGIGFSMMAGAMHMEWDGIELIFNLPDHLRRFASAFDSGDYPQLSREAE